VLRADSKEMTMHRLKFRTCFALLIAGSAVAAQDNAPTVQATQPTVHLGTKTEEFYLSKITVSDLVKSYDFYTKVIGMKLATSPEMPAPKAPTASDPEKEFTEIPLNFSGSMSDPMFVLVKRRAKTPSAEAVEMVTLGFKMQSTKEVVNRALQSGYRLVRSMPQAKLNFLADPDGYSVELIEAPPFPKP
jgi:catechol 2,3-dioxygenase-like lactoylglutathione lyase family enzyme